MRDFLSAMRGRGSWCLRPTGCPSRPSRAREAGSTANARGAFSFEGGLVASGRPDWAAPGSRPFAALVARRRRVACARSSPGPWEQVRLHVRCGSYADFLVEPEPGAPGRRAPQPDRRRTARPGGGRDRASALSLGTARRRRAHLPTCGVFSAPDVADRHHPVVSQPDRRSGRGYILRISQSQSGACANSDDIGAGLAWRLRW